MRVRFHGVRGSTPSPGKSMARYGGNTSCVEVRLGNEILILDAGTGIRDLGSQLATEFADRGVEATLLVLTLIGTTSRGCRFSGRPTRRRTASS